MASGGENLTHVSFRDPVWLSRFPLTEETVIDYFALSQFYDRTCNNEVVKMQQLDPSVMATMTGVEYVLRQDVSRPPRLFILHKQRRQTKTLAVALGVYYVLDGTVFMAPDMRAVLTARLRNAAAHVRAALRGIRKRVDFSAHRGVRWEAGEASGKYEELDAATSRDVERYERHLAVDGTRALKRVRTALQLIETHFVAASAPELDDVKGEEGDVKMDDVEARADLAPVKFEQPDVGGAADAAAPAAAPAPPAAAPGGSAAASGPAPTVPASQLASSAQAPSGTIVVPDAEKADGDGDGGTKRKRKRVKRKRKE